MLASKKGHLVLFIWFFWFLTIVSYHNCLGKEENDIKNETHFVNDGTGTKGDLKTSSNDIGTDLLVDPGNGTPSTNETNYVTNVAANDSSVTTGHRINEFGNGTYGTSANDTRVVDSDKWTAKESNETVTNNKNETLPVFKGIDECKRAEYSYTLLPVHVIICAYSFLGIAVTCKKYFLPSLGRICEVMKMSEDVVGATFMAAGSSAPELATVLIAVFVTQNDIGISDVIGSALFNLLFVISICCFLSSTIVRLNWWPLCRNCFFYAVSVIFMIVAIYDGKVTWFESTMLLSLYVFYCVALYYNVLLEAWAHTLPLPFNKLVIEEPAIVKETSANVIPLQITKQTAYDSANVTNGDSNFRTDDNNTASPTGTINEVSDNTLQSDKNFLRRVEWYTLYPIYFVCKNTIPDCQKKQFSNWFIITFFMSMIWISLYSYLLVQMITLIGVTLHITETVMGLTLLAAGVSVPDAITSINVVKKGYGDMGISNAVGSNIFDVLVCLGLPWFLKTVIVNPGGHVNVESIGMLYSTLLLFSSIALLIATACWNRWVLNKAFGIILMVGYVLFVGIAVAIELIKGRNPVCV